MNFNRHFALEGKHAFLGASKNSWIRYDEDKLIGAYRAYFAKERGTKLHELACQCIKLGVELPKEDKTLNLYVNDAIAFKMKPEVVLYFSDNCFGTADAISFRSNFLRIHDLKTGAHMARMDQLDIYVALFCLEYGFSPNEIDIETRIYQNDEVRIGKPSADTILFIMDKIILFDSRIEQLKLEG